MANFGFQFVQALISVSMMIALFLLLNGSLAAQESEPSKADLKSSLSPLPTVKHPQDNPPSPAKIALGRELIRFQLPKGAELLIDDVLLYEPAFKSSPNTNPR